MHAVETEIGDGLTRKRSTEIGDFAKDYRINYYHNKSIVQF